MLLSEGRNGLYMVYTMHAAFGPKYEAAPTNMKDVSILHCTAPGRRAAGAWQITQAMLLIGSGTPLS